MDTENAWFRGPEASKSSEMSYDFHTNVLVLVYGGSHQVSNLVKTEFCLARSFKNFWFMRSTESLNLQWFTGFLKKFSQCTFEIAAIDHSSIILLIIWMSTYSSTAFLREFFQSISSDIVATIGIPIYKPREYPLQKDENRWGDIANFICHKYAFDIVVVVYVDNVRVLH